MSALATDDTHTDEQTITLRCADLPLPILHARVHMRRRPLPLHEPVCVCVIEVWGSPSLSPTGLICEMTRGVKPILSDVSLIVAGSLEAHPQSSPVKA